MIRTALLALLFTACVVSGSIQPKAIWQFMELIKCAQPGVNPLKYSDYGCWCGVVQSFGPPVDELDQCCKVHDNCYYAAAKAPGCTAVGDNPAVLVYDYTCSNQQVTCSASNDKCQAAVCECDRVAAHCFAQSTYNNEYKGLDSKYCV